MVEEEEVAEEVVHSEEVDKSDILEEVMVVVLDQVADFKVKEILEM